MAASFITPNERTDPDRELRELMKPVDASERQLADYLEKRGARVAGNRRAISIAFGAALGKAASRPWGGRREREGGRRGACFALHFSHAHPYVRLRRVG